MQNINDTINDFETFNFPLFSDIVYIVGIQKEEKFIPFYVGQSSRHLGRMGDYISAQFNAPTDFKVGEAVKYIQQKGFLAVVKFKTTNSRQENERRYTMEVMGMGYELLNDLPGFRASISNLEDERKKVQEFIRHKVLSRI